MPTYQEYRGLQEYWARYWLPVVGAAFVGGFCLGAIFGRLFTLIGVHG